jgi:hypothetical protein
MTLPAGGDRRLTRKQSREILKPDLRRHQNANQRGDADARSHHALAPATRAYSDTAQETPRHLTLTPGAHAPTDLGLRPIGFVMHRSAAADLRGSNATRFFIVELTLRTG